MPSPLTSRTIEHRSTTPHPFDPTLTPHPFRPADLSDVDALGAKRKADALDLPDPDFEIRRRAPSPTDSSPPPRAGVGTFDGTPGVGTPGVGTHMDAEPTEVSGAFSPLQEGPPSLLPAETDEHGLPCVTPEVRRGCYRSVPPGRCARISSTFGSRTSSARVTFAAR